MAVAEAQPSAEAPTPVVAPAAEQAAAPAPQAAQATPAPAEEPPATTVAEAAADGLSNRELAEALFLSPKTVEYHLGNAYRKLQVKGRAELARRIREQSESLR